MFAFLRGNAASYTKDTVVLDVHGVGYELMASNRTIAQIELGQETMLYTHFHITQDSIGLYGFCSPEEKQVFLHLISVSRVGPRLGIAILSTLDAPAIVSAIVLEDDVQLSRVPGLGKKTAQRIILELKEKFAKDDMFTASALPAFAQNDTAQGNTYQEALAALLALGYDTTTAHQALSKVTIEELTVEEILRNALRSLA